MMGLLAWWKAWRERRRTMKAYVAAKAAWEGAVRHAVASGAELEQSTDPSNGSRLIALYEVDPEVGQALEGVGFRRLHVDGATWIYRGPPTRERAPGAPLQLPGRPRRPAAHDPN